MQLFAKHHVEEGIDLIARYIAGQKPHASEIRITSILTMLKSYGAHAQRAIPIMKKAIHYFENEEPDFPKPLSLRKAYDVREAIKEIKAATEAPELIKLGL